MSAGARTPARREAPGARRARTPWRGIGAAVVLLAAASLALWAAAGRSDGGAVVTRFTHIHGLDVPAWADGDVFVSTHYGLLRIDGEGTWREVGTAKHDFMGFRAHPTADGVLYSSGHPAAGSGLPNPIGFMVSRDSGRSWQTLALAGRADFHALAVQPSDGDVVYGFNGAVDPGLYRSIDGGANWDLVESPGLMQLGGPYALAVHPDEPDSLLAGTRAGLLASADAGRTWRSLALDGVDVTAIAFAGADASTVFAYGAAPEMGLVVSGDGGGSWESLGLALDGGDAIGYIATAPEDAGTVYVGSYGMNLYRTRDGGASWQTLAQNGIPE